MFEKIDLGKTADERAFEKSLPRLKERLGVLQRTLRDRNIPTIIVIEGWNASGITMSTHEIIQALDPRGFTLRATDHPTDEERAHTFLWRFWVKTPANGRIAIFARSWYSRALAERLSGAGWKKSLADQITSINNFERQLTDSGAIIIKFFLHISSEEQKVRLTERERNPLTAWLVTPRIWDFHHHYETYLPIIDEFIGSTDTGYAPWHVIGATDRRYTILRVYSHLVKTLEQRVGSSGGELASGRRAPRDESLRKNPLKRRSSSGTSHPKEECQKVVDSLQIEMLELHYLLFKRKIPFVIVYEGWDAAGKGGNITRLARHMNPLGYDVIPVSAPNDYEKNHHYLWRFVRHFPRAGHFAIFDRSWYGRVLVERVEGLCAEAEWKRAYREINEMEQDYVTSSGGGIIKFWLEIDKEEQLKRFRQREADPLKQYKITEEDWRNREKWDLYDTAVDEMLARTSTRAAPWIVIESDEKWYARAKTLKAVISHAGDLL